MKKLARLTFVTSATSSGQTMNDRKLSEVKINDDFHKLSPDKGILKIGPQMAEIGRGAQGAPPHLASLSDVMSIRVKYLMPLMKSWDLLLLM